ncbi:MAG: hypothetical protein LW875_00360 [Proteobacteria bacterium]|jgi:hypothetical protein|nr:hypothetical protein [Pseudomonadota bacterium]
MKALQCQLDLPEAITVGERIEFVCENPEKLNFESAMLKTSKAPAAKYQLKLLKVENKGESSVHLFFTSYKVGSHQFPEVVLLKDGEEFSLGPLNLNVASVIRPEEPPQGPLGPLPALSLSYPLWLWASTLALILMFLGIAFQGIRRRRQRKLWMQELHDHEQALSPIQAFHADVRKLVRIHPAFLGQTMSSQDLQGSFQQLESLYRMYLARQLDLPIHRWAMGVSLKEIKRKFSKDFSEFGEDLQRNLQELQQSQKSQKELKAQDFQQMVDFTRRSADAIEEILRARRKK